MKFPYQRYEVEPSPAFSNGVVHRPEVPLRVIGPTGVAIFLALVDSGADGTILPKSIGEAIGVALDEHQSAPAAGFGGGRATVLPGRVELEVQQGSEQHRWAATVGFGDFASPEDEHMILGHAGFLDYFVATFHGERHELELVATGGLAAT